MKVERPSLWDQMSDATRLELIPIMSTVVLVQAGASVSELIVRLVHLTPFGVDVSKVAATDVEGMLLLVNFTVLLWFGHRAIAEALKRAGTVSIDAKLIGLGTAFVSCADLVTYSIKAQHVDRAIYAVLVLFFVFVVPFFLVRRAPGGGPTSETDDRQVALQAMGASEIVLAAFLPCVAAVLACSLYMVFLNDGLGPVPSLVRDVLKQSGRNEFWGISPGIVGIVWLPALLCTSSWNKENVALRIGHRGRAVVVAVSALLFVVLAVVLLKGTSLVPAATEAEAATDMYVLAKAVLAMATSGMFIAAFAAARLVEGSPHRRIRTLAPALVFAVAGAAVGATIVGIRSQLGHPSAFPLALIGLHAGGFTISYLAGRAARVWTLAKFPGVSGSHGAE